MNYKKIKFKINFITIILLGLGFFGFAQTSFAKDLYVNGTTGNDSTTYAANDADHPWATIGRAAWGNANRATPNSSEAAQAGDTVYVSAGTYTAPDTGTRSGIAFNPVNSGTSESARIIIQAVGTVNLTTSGTLGGPVIGAGTGKHYITWDGFAIDENTYASLESGEQSVVMFYNADYGIVKNCTIIGRTINVAGSNHAGIFFLTSAGSRAYNNKISNVKSSVDITNVSGIYAYGATNLLLDHNEIYDSNTGIFVKGYSCSDVTIRYNNIHNIDRTGIRMAANSGSNTNIHVYQNLLHDIGGIGILSWGNGALGIGTGSMAINNTMYNVGAGFGYSVETTQVLFYNNIVHTVLMSYVYTETYGELGYPTVHDWEHNLYYSATTKPMWSVEGANPNQNWAYWTGTWNQDTATPAGIYGSNPLFVTNGSDFRLQAGSPAINAGIDILDLDNDSSTTDTITIGAYITGNEIIGVDSQLPPPDTTPPAAPSGLIVQ